MGVIRGDCQTLSGHIRRRAERWTEFGVGGEPNRTIFQTPAEGDNDVKEYAVETGRVDG